MALRGPIRWGLLTPADWKTLAPFRARCRRISEALRGAYLGFRQDDISPETRERLIRRHDEARARFLQKTREIIRWKTPFGMDPSPDGDSGGEDRECRS